MRQAQVLSCILFGIPHHKDACGSQAYAQDGIVQRAIRFIKSYAPEIYVIGDVCMCEYTDHGHCGILNAEGDVMNDETLSYLNRIALSLSLIHIYRRLPTETDTYPLPELPLLYFQSVPDTGNHCPIHSDGRPDTACGR